MADGPSVGVVNGEEFFVAVVAKGRRESYIDGDGGAITRRRRRRLAGRLRLKTAEPVIGMGDMVQIEVEKEIEKKVVKVFRKGCVKGLDGDMVAVAVEWWLKGAI